MILCQKQNHICSMSCIKQHEERCVNEIIDVNLGTIYVNIVLIVCIISSYLSKFPYLCKKNKSNIYVF